MGDVTHFGDRAVLAAALSRLPPSYSLALRLRDAGLDRVLIAECLHIEPEAVGPLLAVAELKLAVLMAPEPPHRLRHLRAE
ncbi:hypothetical protein WEH80_16510 [Actinomycetes bacterium KLBMP 9759]